MTSAERLAKLKSKKLCTKCLYPGALVGPKHKCFFTYYCCPHSSHDGNEKCHILLCEKHKKDDKNQRLLQKFKEKFIDNCAVPLPQYSRNLSCFSDMVGVVGAVRGSCELLGNYGAFRGEPDNTERAIFQLQTIEVEGVKLNLFFDSGCGGSVIKKSAIEKLMSIGRAKQIVSGPLTMTGVAGQQSVCHDGVYSVCLPLYNGNEAVLSGLCMPSITGEFPLYYLDNVEKDLHSECMRVGGQELVDRLPKLPSKVGGETDLLVGIQYAKYFPKPIFKSESGLGIYESVFESSGKIRGVASGPHIEFSKIEEKFKGLHVESSGYWSRDVYTAFWRLQNESSLLGFKPNYCMSEIGEPVWCSGVIGILSNGDACLAKRTPKCVKVFDDIEGTGTEITYRCVECRSCAKCKKGPRIDSISIQEEIEQGLIERSVHVDLDR